MSIVMRGAMSLNIEHHRLAYRHVDVFSKIPFLGAYLVRYGKAQTGKDIILHQGSFVSRPSQITVRVTGTSDAITSVQVSGDVAMVASGVIDTSVR